MLIPRSWLDEFVDTSKLSVQQLNDAFNELGLIVEGVEAVGEGLDGIITAKVQTIRAHPSADKIRLVDVITDLGQAEPLQVACGAWNFEEGDVVALATLGSTMPDGMKIERRKLRGEWSNGMLCSSREMKLSEDHSGILRLPADTPLGQPITDALGIAKDVVFDLSVDANRPDAMSVLGVARDLAPKIGSVFRAPTSTGALAGVAKATSERGRVTATDLCDRLTVTVIRNVHVTASSAAVQERLRLAGMRAINNLVDASNLVMLELGIPSHAFDLDRLPGGRIDVRWSAPDETITTLDGVQRTLSPSSVHGARDGIIADGNGTAVGIAAIMGGLTSEVEDDTANLLVEIAHWTPMCIARSSKRLKLRSEASARFERGSDPEAIELAVDRYVELVRQTCPDLVIESYDDLRPVTLPVRRPRVRTARVNLVLGTSLTTEQIAGLLAPIGFASEADGTDALHVTIPSWRPDAAEEIDVIEEVARHHGYGNVERRSLTNTAVGSLTPYQRARRRVGDLLVSRGADEVWTASFLSPGDIARAGLPANYVELANPMVAEESVLRPSLVPGLLGVLKHNTDHRNVAMRIFELGHVFMTPKPDQIVPHEREYLGVLVSADGDDARTAVAVLDAVIEALRVKPEAIELRSEALAGLHPSRSARVVGSGTGFGLGFVGEIDPDVARAYGLDRRVGVLHLDLAVLSQLPQRAETIASWSRYPTSDVDLAFVVPDAVAAADVESALRGGAGPFLRDLRLFDTYRGDRIASGARGLTYRLRFAADDRTLTDADVGSARESAIAAVTKTGAALRA